MAGPLDMIIITGLSGSGKSFAIRALEDNGFFCIDNIPALLIPKVIDLSHGHEEEIRRIALGVDLRGGQFLQALPAVLSTLRHIQPAAEPLEWMDSMVLRGMKAFPVRVRR